MSLSINSKMASAEGEICKDLLNHMLTGVQHSCKAYHIYGDCNDRMYKKTLDVFKAVFKINIPIHVLPAIIFKLKAMSQK